MTEKKRPEGTPTGKRPASQWYWADWLRAPEIRGISLESRGFWMDLLAIMHEGDPYGHLTIAGNPIDDPTLARMVGATPTRVRKLLAELESHRVFSRTDLGVIYSRRMVRDEHIRNVRAAAGKLGGNPNLIEGGKDKQSDNHEVDREVKQSSKQKPTPSSASASASAFASATEQPANNKSDSEYLEPASADRTPRDRFLDRFYGEAPAERRAEIDRQLDQLLEPEGLRVSEKLVVRASSQARLNTALSDILRGKPLRNPDSAIVVLFRKLDDPDTDSAGRTVTEATSAREREQDAMLHRWNRARQSAVEAWVSAHKAEADQFEILAKASTDNEFSFRGRLLQELTKAAGFPDFDTWLESQRALA